MTWVSEGMRKTETDRQTDTERDPVTWVSEGMRKTERQRQTDRQTEREIR